MYTSPDKGHPKLLTDSNRLVAKVLDTANQKLRHPRVDLHEAS